MDMSLIEIKGRANFLIYDYIKNQLNHNDLAEQFRKVIQDSANNHKDIIIFKGLEDLTVVLMKYYNSQGVAAAGEPNGLAEEVEVGSEKGEKKRKKKKQKKAIDEPAADHQSESEAIAECPAEPEEHLIEKADTNTEKRKKKKKKRHAESVAAELLGDAATNGNEVAAQPEEAVEMEEAPKKKRKKQKTAADESAELHDASQANGNQAGKEVESGAKNDADAAVPESEAPGVADAECRISAGKKQKRHSQPYRRVREEEVVNKHFHDNSFDAKPGAPTGWGFKANEDLRPTQGRSFRHEKTKKKRGSYRGGAIETGVSSFKFDSDSD